MGNTPVLDQPKSGRTPNESTTCETQSPGNTLSSINTRLKPGKLAIIDNRSCLREALAVALREHMDKPVVALDSVRTLMTGPEEFNPDISMVILAVNAIEQNELDVQIQSLQEYLPSAFIVLLTDNYNEFAYEVYKRNSLSGVIPSYYRTEQVYLCLCAIESGIKFLPSETLDRQTSSVLQGETVVQQQMPNLDGLLTPRQQEVLRYIAEGRSNKYIAAELSLCESTVKVHVSEVMRRLGATSRTHASYLISNFDAASLKKKPD